MELRLVILHEFFGGVRLQPVINQVNAIEGCVFVFSFFCLCDLAETLFQRIAGLIPIWLEEPMSGYSTGQ